VLYMDIVSICRGVYGVIVDRAEASSEPLDDMVRKLIAEGATRIHVVFTGFRSLGELVSSVGMWIKSVLYPSLVVSMASNRDEALSILKEYGCLGELFG